MDQQNNLRRRATDFTGCPMHLKDSDLTYSDYLKIDTLTSLQEPVSAPAHHDEMLFIIIHQVYELWFKLILHELETAMERMRIQEVLRAHHFIKRIVAIQQLLVQQIHILETMTPADFLQFRDRLNPASGFQSIQFREFEFAVGLKDASYFTFFKNRPDLLTRLEKRYGGPDIRTEFYSMLRRLGLNIPDRASELESEGHPETRLAILDVLRTLYQEPEKNLPLYLLSESLLEMDQYLILWREHHVHVVERVIGFKPGTGGSSGVEYLRSTASKKAFPLLWEVRTHLQRTPL